MRPCLESATRAEFLLETAFCAHKAHLCVSICFGLKWTGWNKEKLIKTGSGAEGRLGLVGQLPLTHRHLFLHSTQTVEELRRGIKGLPGAEPSSYSLLRTSCSASFPDLVSKAGFQGGDPRDSGFQMELHRFANERATLKTACGWLVLEQASLYSENSSFPEKCCPQSMMRLLLEFSFLFSLV